MADRIQVRRGTAAQWVTANTVLAAGEPGLETDTGYLKLGNGSTAWNSLAYAFGSSVNIASKTQTGESISGLIVAPSNRDYVLVVRAPHAGTITETTTKSSAGACTVTFKINSTALGGSANAASTTLSAVARSTSNTFAANDIILITVSANAACANLSFVIKYTRTLA